MRPRYALESNNRQTPPVIARNEATWQSIPYCNIVGIREEGAHPLSPLPGHSLPQMERGRLAAHPSIALAPCGGEGWVKGIFRAADLYFFPLSPSGERVG
jgi:hypothetical protein